MIVRLGSPGSERRRAVRSQVRVAARYISDQMIVDGIVTDISPDGFFFASDFLDPRGELVRVLLEIPGLTRPLELRGEVRWVSDSADAGGMGVRFLGLDSAQRELLSSIGLSNLAECALAAGGC
jgi:uncharacterized protein (TIGR02266 family)